MTHEQRSTQLETWMNMHGDSILRYLCALTGDTEEGRDLTQETFLQAWRFMDSFRGQSNPGTWLHAIARNLARTRHRSIMHAPKPEVFDENLIAGTADDPAYEIVRQEQRERLAAGIDRLPPGFRETVLLFYVSGLSIEDIASVLNVGKGTVKSRLARSRSRLAAWLSPKEDPHG